MEFISGMYATLSYNLLTTSIFLYSLLPVAMPSIPNFPKLQTCLSGNSKLPHFFLSSLICVRIITTGELH